MIGYTRHIFNDEEMYNLANQLHQLNDYMISRHHIYTMLQQRAKTWFKFKKTNTRGSVKNRGSKKPLTNSQSYFVMQYQIIAETHSSLNNAFEQGYTDISIDESQHGGN